MGHVERAARASGRTLVRVEPWVMDRIARIGTIAPDRVDVFAEVESMLSAAQRELAALRDHRALAILASAARIADDHADVPGAAGWIAEVQTAIGIAAAQAGEVALMEVAFTRAALMDPSRGVRAAEAPSHVVERAAAIARDVATRPTGSFEVRAGAAIVAPRVFLNDREVGPAPQLVRAPVGAHVLRVVAPGHRPWGRVVQVLEGRRAPVTVELSPDPLLVEARRLERAAGLDDAAAMTSAVGRLGLEGAWVLEIGGGERDRALLTICDSTGCARTRRLEVDEIPIVVPRSLASLAPASFGGPLSAHRAWLVDPAPTVLPPPLPRWWERWYVWVAAGVVLAGGILGGVILAEELRPEPRRENGARGVCVVGETCPPPL
jgi:hypothetical protein